MNKFYVGAIALITSGMFSGVSAQTYDHEYDGLSLFKNSVYVSGDLNIMDITPNSQNTMIMLSTSGAITGAQLTLHPDGASFVRSPMLNMRYNSDQSEWILGTTKYAQQGSTYLGLNIESSELKVLNALSVGGASTFNEGAYFAKNVEISGNSSFFNTAFFEQGLSTRGSDGQISTTINGDGLYASKSIRLYPANQREKWYTHMEISTITDEAKNTTFTVSTKNDYMDNISYFPLSFTAQDFTFEGASLSLKKLDGKSPVIKLSDDGVVSATSLELQDASGSTFGIKYDEKTSTWGLGLTQGSEGVAPLSMSLSNLSVSKSVTCDSLNTRAVVTSNVVARQIESTSVDVDNLSVHNNFSVESNMSCRNFTVVTGAGASSPALNMTYSSSAFLISAADASAAANTPLNFQAKNFEFLGSSLSLGKAGAKSPAAVLSDSGRVTFKGLSLYSSSIATPEFDISAGEDGSWNLAAPSVLNMNVSKLNVSGPIVCKDQMKVASLETGVLRANDVTVNMNHAADYVFDEAYDLKSLDEVEAFVKENKHLPGVPSASQMEEKGMSVSEMSNLLLEKVEELTLHLIRVEKENRALKAEVERLNERLNK